MIITEYYKQKIRLKEERCRNKLIANDSSFLKNLKKRRKKRKNKKTHRK